MNLMTVIQTQIKSPKNLKMMKNKIKKLMINLNQPKKKQIIFSKLLIK